MDENTTDKTSIYERERREKREKIRELGLDPYGQRTEGVQPLKQIKELYNAEMGHDAGPVVKGAGRVMLRRPFGKLTFITLRDESGDLQIALDKKRLSETSWAVEGLVDLGDLLLKTPHWPQHTPQQTAQHRQQQQRQRAEPGDELLTESL